MRKVSLGTVLISLGLFHKFQPRRLQSQQNLTLLSIPSVVRTICCRIVVEIFVPRQLSALQVAFEIDDNLYEVID